MDWYRLTPEETLTELNSNLDAGLSQEEVQRRLGQYGLNELVERGRKSPWRILLDQFKEIMVIILIIAAILSAVLGEYIEVVVIMAIVLLNAILGFSQEHRAEQAMKALKKMAVPTVRVRRDNHIIEVLSTNLVPGDVILLEAGNLVPADNRILKTSNLKAQESALTGESEPVVKVDGVLQRDDVPLGDRRNMLYMGTIITYGRGTALVWRIDRWI